MPKPATPTLKELESFCLNLQKEHFFSQALDSAPSEFYYQLWQYVTMLVQWNNKMNLVGNYTWQNMVQILLADSWYLADFMNKLPLPDEPETWDLGAGAGLPGIVLRMLWHKGTYTLVEAREKRALFLQSVLALCALSKTVVFRGRAELFMQAAPLSDLVISRAFLPWQEVLALITPHMKQKGIVIFLALQENPEKLPEHWHCIACTSYSIMKNTRFFWALQYT